MPIMDVDFASILYEAGRKNTLLALARGQYGTVGDAMRTEHGEAIRSFLADARWAGRTGRVVDIGTLTYEDRVVAASNGVMMLQSGHVQHPFVGPWAITGSFPGTADSRIERGTALAMQVSDDDPMSFLFGEVAVTRDGDVLLWYLARTSHDDKGLVLDILYDADHVLPEAMRRDRDTDDVAPFAAGLNSVLAAVAICNTRGIAFTEHKPLVRRRKVLKPGYVRFHTGPYFTLLHNPAPRDKVETGHHASPRPHIRRGHVRRLADGREVWVREALIGLRDEAELAFVETRRAYVTSKEEPTT